ncbi:MAG: crotonase/enoyl-CoA hydratase family protein [Deltaproteobacteria bacterium]|nr:crotonase/enoyl-CoA hydratase family protein [Deltaproteobacteria bacterium]MBW2393552.1 crotonase/enoyl-CoA hydratase family protein [Deltaproteobacteria bacterium]
MADEPVRYERHGDVALLRVDDGRANAFSAPLIEALNRQLDRAEQEASAVVWIGRPGCFSGGFDLRVMGSGPAQARALVTPGAELFLRLYEYPRPIVLACTGHALAAGAVALLACDTRIGAAGDYRIGLNEVAIRVALPIFALELARARLSKRHYEQATLHARLYDPPGAVDAGYLDRVVAADELEEQAIAEAQRLGEFRRGAFIETKRRSHGAIAAAIRDTLEEDLSALFPER